ncbi:MAG: 30S ribosomal protein S12 methylthiotransferase RimO [Candidatus Delongbacteria bacterium]|nr:30S ribosomal protein S12 methylthiotransferase RimO [Candidatus Delongbacteria bacterium]MBN2834627.1 30S ribosomal protein S12 methylthiotransferase RimO [Candidatus Delongbacteria bacterium]
MKRIKIVTLGCSKNLVDSEVLGGVLYDRGMEISPDFDTADAIIVNTCGFINTAREESINTILEAVEEKKAGNFKKVYVMGCMSEKYKDEIIKEIPEVDAVYGLKEFDKMSQDISGIKIGNMNELFNERLALESDHFAYIRISDGCDHNCAYCSIPSMRGKYVSRSMESITEEIRNLVDAGVKELILIGQEINSYGLDLYGEKRINILLKQISKIAGDSVWIRLMYTHPPMVDREFLETIASCKNIVKYIDFPVEHTETKILKAMKRGNSREGLLDKIKMMREVIPEICIRTSIIVGFPGETDEVFESMLDFIKEVEFDRLGCFAYSPEEGTPAYDLPNPLSDKIVQDRISRIMEIQQGISLKKNEKLIDTEIKVLIDRHEGEISIGRTYRDAPEIDNEVLIHGLLDIGEYYTVRITDALEFDIEAVLLDKIN